MKRKLPRLVSKRARWYVANVKEITGVNTQGRTLEVARRNLDDATAPILTEHRGLQRECRSLLSRYFRS
jgi:predicted RNase H-like HicB family nuclease